MDAALAQLVQPPPQINLMQVVHQNPHLQQSLLFQLLMFGEEVNWDWRFWVVLASFPIIMVLFIALLNIFFPR
jgi:hypothetical protein